MGSRHFIATSSRRLVTPKDSLVRESYPKWPKHSGQGFIINCPDGLHWEAGAPIRCFMILQVDQFLRTDVLGKVDPSGGFTKRTIVVALMDRS